MERLNNPFVIYGYKGAEYFCDRQKETEAILFTTVSLLFIVYPNTDYLCKK